MGDKTWSLGNKQPRTTDKEAQALLKRMAAGAEAVSRSRRSRPIRDPEDLTPLSPEEAERVRMLLADDPLAIEDEQEPETDDPADTDWEDFAPASDFVDFDEGLHEPDPSELLEPEELPEPEPPINLSEHRPLPKPDTVESAPAPRTTPHPPARFDQEALTVEVPEQITVDLDDGMRRWLAERMLVLRRSPAIRATGMPVSAAVALRSLLVEVSSDGVDWGAGPSRPVSQEEVDARVRARYGQERDAAQGSGSVRQQIEKAPPPPRGPTSRADTPRAPQTSQASPALSTVRDPVKWERVNQRALAMVGAEGWNRWPAHAAVPLDQAEVHELYTSRGWFRMFAARTVPQEDPTDRRFRVEVGEVRRGSVPDNQLIWYWCPRDEPLSGDLAETEPDDADHLMPEALRICFSDRGADCNGAPVQRAVTPFGIIDALPHSWGI